VRKSLARVQDKAEIRERLARIGPDSVRRWGRMSAHQMVCHLADSFRLAVGRKHARPIGGRLRASAMRALALYLPMAWPPGIVTTPEFDQDLGGTRPVEFAADMADLLALFESVTGPEARLHGRPHPVFGCMSEAEWLRWGYLHMNHHLRQFGV
jgi:hypothetical protein